jgi:hypothetical protein
MCCEGPGTFARPGMRGWSNGTYVAVRNTGCADEGVEYALNVAPILRPTSCCHLDFHRQVVGYAVCCRPVTIAYRFAEQLY